MDLTTTTINNTATIKTPEADNETPTRIQPIKPLSLTNGVLKRHHPLRHHNHHHVAVVVTYKECLKNHAASLGGHAVDGCGEFMPSPTATATDPTSLKCAACGCHRNFHRRDPEEPPLLQLPPNPIPTIEYQPLHRHHPPPPPPPQPLQLPLGSSPPNSPSPPPISSSYYPSAPHMLLALSTSLSGPPPENNPMIPNSGPTTAGLVGNPNARKRFRTKFSQEQKEKMMEFADRVGWKMQKREEDSINAFCGGIGVDKGVFKVWMHNNKNSFGKRENHNGNNDGDENNINGTNGNEIGGTISIDNDAVATTTETHFHHHHDHQKQQHDDVNQHFHSSDSVSGHVVPTNGSSSSS